MTVPADPEQAQPVLAPTNTFELELALVKAGYNLKDIRRGSNLVPALYLANLPADLGSVDQVARKKQLFFSAVLPLVLRANDAVARERVRLVRFRDRFADGAHLSATEKSWIRQLARKYKVKVSEKGLGRKMFEALLLKVDRVPVSLALAQAAVESGWGSSRFAKKANALFGQRAWSEDAGLVPEERADDETHVVKSFDSLMASVNSYVRNLNSHPSYRDFRQERAKMRAEGQPLDGYELAGGLLRYAETGEQYVDTLRTVISKNHLQDFDGAMLQRRIVTASN